MRYLFLDDGELTSVTGLTRRVHQPRRHPANPVLAANQPWESTVSIYGTVLYDRQQPGFRCWYLTSPSSNEERVEIAG